MPFLTENSHRTKKMVQFAITFSEKLFISPKQVTVCRLAIASKPNSKVQTQAPLRGWVHFFCLRQPFALDAQMIKLSFNKQFFRGFYYSVYRQKIQNFTYPMRFGYALSEISITFNPSRPSATKATVSERLTAIPLAVPLVSK